MERLADRADVDSQSIAGIGIARGSIPLLYAAVFDGRIHSLDLDGMLASYSSIVDSRLHRNVFEQILPGVIRHFDLPDLVAAMAPRKVSLRGLVEAMGDPAPSEMVDKLYGRLAR